MKNVGIFLVCTGKYDVFLESILDGINKNFLKNHNITVFIIAGKGINVENYIKPEYRINILYRFVENLPFPYPTLFRYKYFTDVNEELSGNEYLIYFTEQLEDLDYIYYIDVDMAIVSEIGEEIFSDGLTVTQHPGYHLGGWGSQNTHNLSSAYLDKKKWGSYYAGGFQGGKTDVYLKMCEKLKTNIEMDLETAKRVNYTKNDGILAEWHDESHFNHYVKTNTNIKLKVLSPAYCYPEGMRIDFPKKIVALNKNHNEIRKI
tara:strand:- start:5505 stop:6287 length:783 start_codon:yes stop_codon:yes gene_type:complete